MCRRFSQNLGRHARAIVRGNKKGPIPLDCPPRYNIAPSQLCQIIIHEDSQIPVFDKYHWGPVPFWAKNMIVGTRLVTARFAAWDGNVSSRAALARRRCLVPASGFYEWRRNADQTRTPYYFSASDGEDFLLAGLWEDCPEHGEAGASFTIITTAANELMSPIHDSMPAILPECYWDLWLDPGTRHPADFEEMLSPVPESFLRYWRVGNYVDNVRNEGERCIEKVA